MTAEMSTVQILMDVLTMLPLTNCASEPQLITKVLPLTLSLSLPPIHVETLTTNKSVFLFPMLLELDNNVPLLMFA
jgi:hypothetical protein